MRGFATDIEPAYGEVIPFSRQVVGVVCASDFPDPSLVTSTIQKGQNHDPDTVWVVRDRDRVARAALDELGLEYVSFGLNPYWKFDAGGDWRGTYRTYEIINYCSIVLTFTSPDSGSLRPFVDKRGGKVRVIERGKAKKRKGRKVSV